MCGCGCKVLRGSDAKRPPMERVVDSYVNCFLRPLSDKQRSLTSPLRAPRNGSSRGHIHAPGVLAKELQLPAEVTARVGK